MTERGQISAGDPATCDVAAGTLIAVALDGSNQQVLASGLWWPSPMVLDDTGIYWVNNGDAAMNTGGSLMRIPKLPKP